MSEGELKKRFEQKVKFGFILDFYKDLDEAKKEFPMNLWNEDDHNLTDDQESKIDCERNRQTLAWFLKWFGFSYKICGNESPQYKILCTEPAGHKGNHKGNIFVWADAAGIILGEDEDRKLKGGTP